MRFIDIVKNKKKDSKQKGFTVIELMISTIIFSLVLLGASAGIIEIGKKYYRGITYARTQNTVRSVSEELTQAIKYTEEKVKIPNYPETSPGSGITRTTYGPVIGISASTPDTFLFCIGSKRYTFAVDRKLNPDAGIPTTTNRKEKRHVFWVDEPDTGCAENSSVGPANLDSDTPSDPSFGGRELLDKNMRIQGLSVIPVSSELWNISVTVAYGDDDAFMDSADGPANRVCQGTFLGTEFCAVSKISVYASKRVQ